MNSEQLTTIILCVQRMVKLSPIQIYLRGVVERFNSNYFQVCDIANGSYPIIDPEQFGVEHFEQKNDLHEKTVNVPRPTLELNVDEFADLLQFGVKMGFQFYLKIIMCQYFCTRMKSLSNLYPS